MTKFTKNELTYSENNQRFLLTIKHYLGFVVLAINFLTYFFARKYYKIVLGLTLFFGLFNLVNFTISQITTSIKIGGLTIGCQPYIFIIMIITYILNRESVNGLLSNYINPTPEKMAQMQQKYEQETIQKFVEKYQSYSEQQLETILTDKQYIPEAIEASRIVLEERKNK